MRQGPRFVRLSETSLVSVSAKQELADKTYGAATSHTTDSATATTASNSVGFGRERPECSSQHSVLLGPVRCAHSTDGMGILGMLHCCWGFRCHSSWATNVSSIPPAVLVVVDSCFGIDAASTRVSHCTSCSFVARIRVSTMSRPPNQSLLAPPAEPSQVAALGNA
jgi:hypothetical protein